MIIVTVTNRNGEREVYELDGEVITIGRNADNDVVLAGGSISNWHARLDIRDSRLFVTDLKSTNGVRINGRSVVGEMPFNIIVPRRLDTLPVDVEERRSDECG